ncbi:MAG: hypothetical protein LKE17_04095 [Lactobacillus sp.]|jgi:hypothetical protein|nr:hypothetical protein [Lactobacillus sp.]
MKKNVKILGAAAAALLAVAPVAASATPTFAADNRDGNSQIISPGKNGNKDNNEAQAVKNVNITANAVDKPGTNQGGNSQIIDPGRNGNKDNNEAQAVRNVNITANAVVKPGTINSFTPLASANQFSATNADNGSALSGFQVISITDTSNIYEGNITEASALSSATSVKYGQKLEAGEEYTQVLSATVLTPAKAGTQYTFNGSTTEPSSETKYVTNVPVLVHIKAQDSTLTGNPYVANSNNDSFNDKQVGAEYKGDAITNVNDMVAYISGLRWKTYTSSTDTDS